MKEPENGSWMRCIDMKIIALDFDGVINSKETMLQGIDMDPLKVALVERICKETGAKIVISSAWRICNNIEQLEDWLCVAGLSRGRVIGATPITRYGPRGKEIQQFLDDNDVDKYLILDDDSDMLKHQLPFFIHTNFDFGLQPEHVDEAIRILGHEEAKEEESSLQVS